MSTGGFIVPKAWRQILLKECSRMRRKTLGLDTWIIEEVLFQLGRIWKFFFGKKRIAPATRVLLWWEKPPEHVNCRCHDFFLEEEEGEV